MLFNSSFCISIFCRIIFFLSSIPLPPSSPLTATPFPYTTLCRSTSARARNDSDTARTLRRVSAWAIVERYQTEEHTSRNRFWRSQRLKPANAKGTRHEQALYARYRRHHPSDRKSTRLNSSH